MDHPGKCYSKQEDKSDAERGKVLPEMEKPVAKKVEEEHGSKYKNGYRYLRIGEHGFLPQF
jgi:hypothetical protein